MEDAIYPSYKNLDPFIDVKRLKALDGFITNRLRKRLAAADDRRSYTSPFLLDAGAPALPGYRMVYLSRSRGAENYYDLDRIEIWEPTSEAEEYAPLMDFIATLPFAATARMLIMYDPGGRAVSAHKDHDSTDLCHEFIWFRTNLGKPFYMLDPSSGERSYVAGHAAWFDTVNQFHGADASGALSFSIRVDGVFSETSAATSPSRTITVPRPPRGGRCRSRRRALDARVRYQHQPDYLRRRGLEAEQAGGLAWRRIGLASEK